MLDWTDRRPQADLDLHGQTVLEAIANAERFLRAQGKVRPGAVVRVVTGRGRGGGGAPIRTRVRTLLRGMRDEGAVVRDYVLEELRRELSRPTTVRPPRASVPIRRARARPPGSPMRFARPDRSAR